MDKKIKNDNCKNISKETNTKGIIFSTINPIFKNNEEEMEIDKDYFRGGSRLARVYNVRDKTNNN